jgi:hypothetical protein
MGQRTGWKGQCKTCGLFLFVIYAFLSSYRLMRKRQDKSTTRNAFLSMKYVFS